jgi:hypothetical protein
MIVQFIKYWSNWFGALLILGVFFHSTIFWYGTANKNIMFNVVPDTGAVISMFDLYLAIEKGGDSFFEEYTRSHIYPLGYSLFILPGSAAHAQWHIFKNPQLGEDVALLDAAILPFLHARFLNFVLFIIGAIYVRKIATLLESPKGMTMLCFALYVFSPYGLIFSFQERPHLPAALLFLPAMYYALYALNTKRAWQLIRAGALCGLAGSIIQYGFVLAIGLCAALLVSHESWSKKIRSVCIAGISCLIVALLFGYPGLVTDPLGSVLNETHRSTVAFNGSGFVGIVQALIVYEPFLLLFFAYTLICFRKSIQPRNAKHVLLFVPIIVFVLVFGAFQNFHARQIAGIVTLLPLVVLLLHKKDITRRVVSVGVLLSVLACSFVWWNARTNKPSYVLAYDYVASAVSSNSEAVLDIERITTYWEPLSYVMIRKHIQGDEREIVVPPYRRFPFVYLPGTSEEYIRGFIDSATPRFVIAKDDSFDLNGDYDLVYESPYESKQRATLPLRVKYPGRTMIRVYEKKEM